jgi:hypothetical protein
MNAQEYRQLKAQKPKGDAIDVTLPSGAVFKLRKVSMVPYALSANMPRVLQQKAAESWKAEGLMESDGPLAQKLQAENVEDNKQALILVSKVIQDACVSPRIEVGGGVDALDPSELEEPDVWHIFKWATNQLPGSVVETAGGPVEHDALAKFRKQPARKSRTRTPLEEVLAAP